MGGLKFMSIRRGQIGSHLSYKNIENSIQSLPLSQLNVSSHGLVLETMKFISHNIYSYRSLQNLLCAQGRTVGTPWGPEATSAESCPHPTKHYCCFSPPIAERHWLSNVGICTMYCINSNIHAIPYFMKKPKLMLMQSSTPSRSLPPEQFSFKFQLVTA